MSSGGIVTQSVKELTVRAILLGLVLSVVMGAANVYLGLKAGMTVSASIPAAVIAMAILRIFFRSNNILEANQVQTAASAGESLAAGVIFTLPALILIGAWTEFDPWLTPLIAFSGGLLGILFMIPMRRVFVVGSSKELRFPEGVACATMLKSAAGQSTNRDGFLSIMVGLLAGSVFKFFGGFARLFVGTLEGATQLGKGLFFFGGDVSPALVSVGYIVGLPIAVLIFIGGALGWLIGIPILSLSSPIEGNLVDAAYGIWSTQVRYIGVGAMVVGGIASIIRVRLGLVQAVKEIKAGISRRVGEQPVDDLDRDIRPGAIIALSILAAILVGIVYYHMTSHIGITILITGIMLLMSFFFTAVASYIVGLVGNSNSPVSGMTITTVLFTGLLLVVLGYSGSEGMVAILGVASIVCCAACTSGDVCNDLKTGHIVGASPFRQQIMQIAGIALAALVMAPVLQLLHNNTPGGIGGRELPAPQAALFASLARGFFGEEGLPWNLVVIGAVLGAIIWAADSALDKRGSSFRLHIMPIAVGLYLPFGLAVPILLGGILSHVAKRDERGILFASGVIAGESLMGVGIALLASVGVAQIGPFVSPATQTGITWVAAIAFVLLFIRFMRTRNAQESV